jgi:hypothetical protein
LTPDQFRNKWTAANLSERSAAQQHFLDLCALLDEPTPAEADPDGDTYTFEKGGTTAIGGHGWADVWKKGAFAWEYKGPGKDLKAAYLQLKKYADMLENPPLLITSDTKRIEIHTNFTSTVKRVHVLELVDLEDGAKRELLKNAFSNPERLRPGITRHMVTKDAAESFSQLAHHLQAKGFDPQRVAHFLNRLIFCMFAEDVGLLPNQIFTQLATASVAHPESFEANARQLFAGMAKGGDVAFQVIDWFNGGLFDDDATLPLDEAELKIVLKCAALDWSNIEPSIFGTLFERGLDPDKRSQQGAHYTDPDTIMKIVGPVVLEPWQREWESERAEIAKLIEKAKKTVSEAAKQRYFAFLERLVNFRVLDPACGSGNFLYLSLRCLKDFEKRVIHDAEILGLPLQFPRVGPEAVLGIEVNPYAAELARVTIWIGELQWMLENGFAAAKNPILKPLDQIECRDAILNDDGTEPTWPKADAIVGNPPFLGAKLMNRRLGPDYTARLRNAYVPRLKGFSDLACYWFERSRTALSEDRVQRVGLVATSSIRGGTNRPVLDAICAEDRIFDAWSEQPWVLDGANVEVSLICFARSRSCPTTTRLDGEVVENINPDLTTGLDLTRARPQAENEGISFLGIQTTGPHDVDGDFARTLLAAPSNPNGEPNAAILKPYWNGDDLTGRPRDRWLLDFPLGLAESQAAAFEAAFEHLKHARYSPGDARDVRTLPEARATVRDTHARERWWEPYWPRPEMRARIRTLPRYIVTPETAQYRLFVWLAMPTLPDKNLIVIARDDDTTFGILHSRAHELWSLRLGTSLEDRPRYTSTTTFATYPFPDGLTPKIAAADYAADPRAQRIGAAAKRLNELRDNWLNPSELVDRVPEVVPGYPDRLMPKNAAAAADHKKRTLTNLYNANPAWLQHAHRELDEAVAAAYGWEWPLADEEILKRLFELNQKRAGEGRRA